MTTKLIDRPVSSLHFANFTNRQAITSPTCSSLVHSDCTTGGSLLFPSLESTEKRANVLSPRASLYWCDRMLSITSTWLMVASMMSQCQVQTAHLGPSLSVDCASVMCWQVYPIQFPNSNVLIPLRFSAFKPPKDRLLLDWLPSKAGRNAEKMR